MRSFGPVKCSGGGITMVNGVLLSSGLRHGNNLFFRPFFSKACPPPETDRIFLLTHLSFPSNLLPAAVVSESSDL